MAGIALPKADFTEAGDAAIGRGRIVHLAGRYSLSTIGPIAVSGAHFAASLIFLHRLPPAEFGLFAFLLVVVPFCLSISSGLLGAPLLSAVGKAEAVAESTGATLRDANRAFCLFAGLGAAVLMWLGGAGVVNALLLGVYGTAMALRWFWRFSAYNANDPFRAAASDLVYSICLLGGLSGLIAADRLSLETVSIALLASAIMGVAAFGWRFLKDQFHPMTLRSFAGYAPMWRDITRWSLMGVVLSEMTANAHAYLVTFISGTQAFALLAAGSLLMRPLLLVLSALTDRERPTMARFLAAGNIHGAMRVVKEFRIAAYAVWLATAVLSIAIFVWYPHLVIRQGFDAKAVMVAVAIWSLIVAVRAARAPEAAFLQAAGAFHALARAGMAGSVVSLVGTLVILVILGPVPSLGGILAGEIAMSLSIVSLMRSWKRAHA
jgi:hypothetical protein